MLRGILIIVLISFSSCVPVYVPMRHNVPMHSGKNEFQASANVIQGLNIQTAYAVTNHFGVTANYLYANNKGDGPEYRTQSVGEIGIGYFNNFKENWCVELYGGYGAGDATAFGNDYFLFSGNEYKVNGSYQKVFLQPSIGIKSGNLISNLSIKCSLIDFTKFQLFIDGVEEKPEVASKIFIAPATTIHFPLFVENLYGTAQVGLNFAAGKEPAYDYEPLMASIGLSLKIKVKD